MDEWYGWVCVGCQFFINFMSWGVNSSYGVYLSYYLENDYFPDGSHLKFAFIGGLSMSMALLFTPVQTFLMLKYHFKLVGLVNGMIMSLGLLGASFATKAWHLFLSQGICFGIGMSGIFVVSLNVPLKWFDKRRGLATAIGSAGSGAGGLFWSQVIGVIIRKVSLPWALRVSAIVSFTVNTTALIILKQNKAVPLPNARHYLNFNLLKSKGMYGLFCWAAFFIFGYVALLFSLSSYCRSVGISSANSSLITGLLNAGMFIGRPFVGYFGDRFGRLNIACILTSFTGIALFLYWPFISSFGSAIPFAIIVGIACGIFWATAGSCTAEIAGLDNVDAGLAMIWLTCVIPATFSEPIALVIFNKSRLGLVFFSAASYIVSAGGIYFAKISKQKQVLGKEMMLHPFKKV